MLLSQPFDPFIKEQQQQHQRKAAPFLARFRVISRTRRALLDLKNRVVVQHENKTRHNRHFLLQQQNIPALMMPDHRFMLNFQYQAIPPPWCGCSYDPYMSPNVGLIFPPLSLPPHPGVYHPPPVATMPLSLPPLPPHHQLPYCICVHISSLPLPPPRYQQQQHQYKNNNNQRNNESSSSLAESTLYSSGISTYSDIEKELINKTASADEEKEQRGQEEQPESTIHPLQQRQQCRSLPAAIQQQMHPSNSDDVAMPQQQQRRRHTIHHHPSFSRSWTSNDDFNYG